MLVNVNPAYRSHELQYVLEKSAIRVLFLHERDQRAGYRAILGVSLEDVNCWFASSLRLSRCSGYHRDRPTWGLGSGPEGVALLCARPHRSDDVIDDAVGGFPLHHQLRPVHAELRHDVLESLDVQAMELG